jgi:chromosome segregation ATPase
MKNIKTDFRKELIEELSEVNFIPNPPEEKLFESVFDKILVHSSSWDELCERFPVKKARQHYLSVQYLFSRYYVGYNEFEREITWLRSLVINLDKEKNSLKENVVNLERKVKELEAKQKELEARVEELDDEVWMEREEAEKALDKSKEWRERQMFEVVLKHDAAMGKLLDRIDLLESNLATKNQEIKWRDYLATKELPALPKQQKENRLRKFKQLVNKVKEKTKEKFQTFIIQKVSN